MELPAVSEGSQLPGGRRHVGASPSAVWMDIDVTSRWEWQTVHGVSEHIVAHRRAAVERSHLFGVPGFSKCVLLAAGDARDSWAIEGEAHFLSLVRGDLGMRCHGGLRLQNHR